MTESERERERERETERGPKESTSSARKPLALFLTTFLLDEFSIFVFSSSMMPCLSPPTYALTLGCVLRQVARTAGIFLFSAVRTFISMHKTTNNLPPSFFPGLPSPSSENLVFPLRRALCVLLFFPVIAVSRF